ncbi:conjugal transfer protein TraX [Pseudomonas cichorii]|nr:conjugal transfer protein TraX [Pseudomonas cichorii]MBX8493189.1 conjugal transfer protein TraX [Pseudomonas cichorii]
METEKKELPTDKISQDEGPTPLRRAAQIGISFINPFSDLMVIYRTGIKPIGGKLRNLREQLQGSSTVKEELSFTQAVARSGRSEEQLKQAYTRIRTLWWCVMVVACSLSLVLLLMLVAANVDLPTITLARAIVADLVLISLGLFSFAMVVKANYRLWQLATRRVSVEERGTFEDFKTETRMWSQVMTPTVAY